MSGQFVRVRRRPVIVMDVRQRQNPNTSESMNYMQVEYIDGGVYPQFAKHDQAISR